MLKSKSYTNDKPMNLANSARSSKLTKER